MQERAADRGWGQYPEPEWMQRRKRAEAQRRADARLNHAFRWTVAGFLLWPILAPVLLGMLVLIVLLIGSI
jgi:hypothetical protein